MLYAADLVVFCEIVNFVQQYKVIVLSFCPFVGRNEQDLITFFSCFANALCYGQSCRVRTCLSRNSRCCIALKERSAMTETIEGLPLADRLAKGIRTLLISGELMPGQRLSEAAFSERFDVSRNSLREAFRLLTKDGLLRHEANRGVFVAVPTMSSVIDIYRVRRMVECGALRQAWHKHPAIKTMRAAVEDAKVKREDADWLGVGSANMKFHAAVVDLLDSARLSDFYERIAAELRLCFGLLKDPEQLHSPFVDMNSKILSLMEEGKAQEAGDEMEIYLNLSERTVLKALERAVEHAS
jgi:DNA-binding GntR family transcriptional regulator